MVGKRVTCVVVFGAGDSDTSCHSEGGASPHSSPRHATYLTDFMGANLVSWEREVGCKERRRVR